VTTWRHFASKTFPRVARELGIPCATSGDIERCPRHGTLIGTPTGICVDCHTEAWDEVGRRYAAQGCPVKPERPASTFPGPNRKPLFGQLSLLGDEVTEEEIMNTNTELAESELLPAVIDEPPPATVTLFGTSDPRAALEKMGEVATVLVDVIRDRKLFARISGHEHITAEGWTTLGAMLGVVPVVCWTKPNETNDGYLARVEARTLDGRVVGAAESECSRAERRWKSADAYAIRSMAQTRAIGRALRAPLGQIVVLAGYEPASAEEMPVLDARSEREPAAGLAAMEASVSGTVKRRRPDLIPEEDRPTEAQIAELRALLEELGAAWPEVDWKARAKDLAGTPGNMLTATTIEILLGKLRNELEAR
jgi:hypothetical protein